MVTPSHLKTTLENKIQVFSGKGKTEKDLEIWIKKTYKVTQIVNLFPIELLFCLDFTFLKKLVLLRKQMLD